MLRPTGCPVEYLVFSSFTTAVPFAHGTPGRSTTAPPSLVRKLSNALLHLVVADVGSLAKYAREFLEPFSIRPSLLTTPFAAASVQPEGIFAVKPGPESVEPVRVKPTRTGVPVLVAVAVV